MNAPRFTLSACSLLAAAAVGLPMFLSAEEGVVLKPSYKPGMSYQFRQTQQMDMTMTLPQAAEPVEQKVESLFDMSAVASKGSNGNLEVVTTIDRVKMHMSAPKMGMEMKYDSASEADQNSAYATMFGSMVGQAFTLVYDSDGKLSEVKGGEVLLGGANPQMQQMLSTEQLAQMGDPSFVMGLDEKPKKVGDRWEASPSMPIPQMGTFEMPMKLQYARNESVGGHECARVEFEGSASMKPDASGEGVMLPGMKIEGSKLGGYWAVDPALGHIRLGEMSMDMTLEMPDPSGSGSSLKIPMKQKTRFEMLNAEPTG